MDKVTHSICALGMAENFAVLRALVTVGIPAGHMKLHSTHCNKNFDSNYFFIFPCEISLKIEIKTIIVYKKVKFSKKPRIF
jgi:hypothetical protein